MGSVNDRDIATRLTMALLGAGLSALSFAGHPTPARTLESAFKALTLRDHHHPTTQASLLALPAELRLEIFDYLIRPGDVYVRWSARAAHHDVRFTHYMEDWDNDPSLDDWLTSQRVVTAKPPRSPTHAEVQLFLVCTQLRDEGIHYYLTKNTFHLMGADCALPYLS